ncbi:sensor histidine kinase [Kiloniella majae]|uniref:sensor histidine kinase n=1 Tax=Kiloniella majae TaxID=1938558 RepID=UPI000A27916B|nr:HAMP domain-containing sensor histidine kinase [Kiloniella majae]
MAVLFLMLCGTAVIILGYFSYYFTRGHFVHGTEAIIDTDLSYVSQWQDPARIANALDRPDRVYLLLSPDGKKIVGNLDELPETVSLLAEGTLTFSIPVAAKANSLDTEKDYAAKIYTYPNKNRLLIGVDITPVTSDYKLMQWLSFLSIGFMVLVIITSYLISRFVATNTNRIALTAKQIIETGDLSQRIELTSRWDDLSYMAGVINDLLDRIQLLMRGIRQVSDNIAHDLRTPLTRLHHNLEALRSQDHIAQNQQAYETVDKLVNETDQMQRTFNALLRISRIESGKQHSAFEPLALDDLLQDVIELYEPLLEEKSITLKKDFETLVLQGDRNLLFQAFGNLMDNAVKFTPIGGRIDLGLHKQGTETAFVIEDNGPGVPSTDLEKIFERFYRAESSRHTPGSGLGLSLVGAVTDLHQGHISAENGEKGLRLTIRFS